MAWALGAVVVQLEEARCLSVAEHSGPSHALFLFSVLIRRSCTFAILFVSSRLSTPSNYFTLQNNSNMLATAILSAFLTVPALVAAQSVNLAGQVGPLTSIAAKRAVKICNITSYGAKADGATDISAALNSAFTACKAGGVVVIPAGNFALSTWVTFNGGNKWALQLDGTIIRTGTAGGNMIMIEHGTDFEMFSSTGAGAIQGLGYVFHATGSTAGPRLLRTYQMTSFSIHDIKLVDSPVFHLSLDTCNKGELYNLAIRGGNKGGLDGIDIWSTNIWVHDVMVTNKVMTIERKFDQYLLIYDRTSA